MRIAFLNPWRNSAENQAFKSLEIAASRIGHQLVYCTNSDEVEQAEPAFVLAAASTQPKLTRFPTYGVIHEPRDRFLSTKDYFHNLLSYDGYLTISDTLRVFLANLFYGVGRPTKIGYYYNSCQQNTPDPNFHDRLRKGKVKLTYFGTNWDKRRTRFFQSLSDLNDVEIYGPQRAWSEISRRSYKGALPFDGCSVQERYRQNGIGLVLLSDKHLADDIISNRIFEITSVGAIVVCCRTNWIVKHFGDTVYYFEQATTARQIIEDITAILKRIKDHPSEAYSRAQQAHRIFEEKFCAEKLLQNAIDYDHELTQQDHSVIDLGGHRNTKTSPLISVIVRCGGRPLDILRRAVRSIATQTFGRFQVIFVRYKPLDLGPLLSEFQARLDSTICVDCFRGDRSKTLWCGLREVRGEYFSILDDDDELMPDHFYWLFYSPNSSCDDSRFVYTGFVEVDLTPTQTPEGNPERRRIFSFGISHCQSFFDQSQFFSPNCFMASSSLLSDRLLVDPELKTAEDSYLILSLLAQSRARFNFRATAIHYASPESSGFARDPNRANDVLNMYLRLLPYYHQAPQSVDAHKLLRLQNEAIIYPKIYDLEETEKTVIYHCRDFSLSQVPRSLLDVVPFSLDPQTLGFAGKSFLVDAKRGVMSISPPCLPWAYTALFKLVASARDDAAHLVELDCTIAEGTLGFGVLNQKEDDFVYRIGVPASAKRIVVHLPIESFATVGRVVIQNWDVGAKADAKINGITLLSEMK